MMRRRLSRLSGIAGFLLLAGASLHGFLPLGVVPVSPDVAAAAGLFFVVGCLFTAAGYRKPAFWCALTAGCGLIIASFAAEATFLHSGMLVLTGTVLLLVSRIVMTRTRVNGRRLSAAVVLVSAAAVLLPRVVEIPAGAKAEEVPYAWELEELLSLIHPGHGRFGDQVKEILKDLAGDESMSREEQEKIIGELNRRIETLEGDIRRFEETRAERDRLAAENEAMRRQLAEREIMRPEAEDLKMVSSYEEAVRPEVPLVRDFAVTIASSHPGSYYRSPGDTSSGVPGKTGVLQAAALHRYVFSQWKYVNDSLVISGDYYSPADRTIAAGLAGDCDDFAILLASCVEAVGGRARIMHGRCDDGSHAWCEVYIGPREAWNEAVRVIGGLYPGRKISYLVPESNQGYWLCLDWELGTYSCGGSARVAYQLRGGYGVW